MDPITIILIVGGITGIALFASQGMASATNSSSDTNTPNLSGTGYVNDLGLMDIAPLEQHGSFTTQYDSYFEAASEETGIPFALIKAHAQRESAFNPNAYRLEPSGKASFGLMQILWWAGSARFQKYGYSDDTIGDGSYLYQPGPNCKIAASIMLDNWNQFKNLRDMINAYNTGVSESSHPAPNNYVNDVLKTYSSLVGTQVS